MPLKHAVPPQRTATNPTMTILLQYQIKDAGSRAARTSIMKTRPELQRTARILLAD